LDIPKRKLTVFTGVSGSGKSSLVFGTIAAESQRLINETYTAFIQSFMPSLGRPDVDSLTNLSAAIIVDQERMGANSRSTVGTATDTYSMLRIIYSRLGDPHIGGANAYGFNDPQGMCPNCEGLGRVSTIDVDGLVDRNLSLNEGGITFPNFAVGSWYWTIFADSGFFDVDKPLRDYTEAEWEQFLHGPESKVKLTQFTLTYEGLVDKFRRLYASKDLDSMQPTLRAAVERVATSMQCPDCAGARLNQAALSSRIGGRNIAECAAMQVSDLAQFVADLDAPEVAPLLGNLQSALDDLVRIGLGYLSLNRESSTLSGGEAQRVKMVRHLGSSLTDLTYVFDEPTIGLHPHDVQNMNDLMLRLRDKGNTVLVVEHKPEVIAIADHGRPGSRRRATRGCGRLRGRGGRSAQGRHLDRQAPRPPPDDQSHQPYAHRLPAHRTRRPAQPARRVGRHPLRSADRDHRRRRLGQEFADQRLSPAKSRRRDLHRSGRHPRLATLQSGDLHRDPRTDPQGLRPGEQGETGTVQRQLRGCLPGVQGHRSDLHRPRLHGRCRLAL
jgi:excinuclease UvrABC ATPase subunit